MAASATPSIQVLIYGTGGYAWSDNRLTATVRLSVSDSNFHSGWTVGAGVEVMFAPKWSVKAEYLYRSFEGADLLHWHCAGGLPSERSISTAFRSA